MTQLADWRECTRGRAMLHAAHGSSTDCGTASWSTRRGKEALTARAMTSLVEGLNSEGTRNTKHSRCGGAHRVASPSTTFFRYRVFLGHPARIVRKGRVLSDAEYTFWRLQTRARRQLSAPSAPLTSPRAETASFRVDLACGGVEAKSTVRKSGDTGRSAPPGLAIHAVLAFPEEVKRHARRRAICWRFGSKTLPSRVCLTSFLILPAEAASAGKPSAQKGSATLTPATCARKLQNGKA